MISKEEREVLEGIDYTLSRDTELRGSLIFLINNAVEYYLSMDGMSKEEIIYEACEKMAKENQEHEKTMVIAKDVTLGNIKFYAGEIASVRNTIDRVRMEVRKCMAIIPEGFKSFERGYLKESEDEN